MGYRVTSLRIDDHRQGLVELWQQNFRDPLTDPYTAERFAWLYQRGSHDSQTWLAVDSDSNTVVGCGSAFRAAKQIRGEIVGAGVSIALAVEQRHRTAAAALAIQRALTADAARMGWRFLVAKPNDKALPIFSRVGYRSVGLMPDWGKMLDREIEPGPDAPSYVEEIVGQAYERFDRLWERAHPRYRFVGEKTSAFLNWRYSGFQAPGYRFYCLLGREDRQLLAYLVFYGWRRGYFIADLFCEDPTGPALDNLLLGFAGRMKQQGGSWIGIAYFGVSSFEDDLLRLGFIQCRSGSPLVAYVDPSLPPEFGEEIFDKNNWFTFAGETHIF